MAEDTIAVRPARKGMGLSHPVNGPLRDEGGDWPADSFTFRRITDGDVKRLTSEQAEERRQKAKDAEDQAQADAKAKGEAEQAAKQVAESPVPEHDIAAPAAAPVAQEPAPQVGASVRPARR